MGQQQSKNFEDMIFGHVRNYSGDHIGTVYKSGIIHYSHDNEMSGGATISLKKLKSNTVQVPYIKSLGKVDIIGQIVDKTKKYTRGLIIASQTGSAHKLVLIKDTPVLENIPIYATMDTKL